jgi:hypothetical protein
MNYPAQVFAGIFAPVFVLVLSVIGTVHANPFSFNANSVEPSDKIILAKVDLRDRSPFKRNFKKREPLEKIDFALLEEVTEETDEIKANKKKGDRYKAGTPNSARPPLNRHTEP